MNIAAPRSLPIHRAGDKGPAVVLVHGNSCSARAFGRQLAGPLAARCRLHAIDLPGHGTAPDATHPAEEYSIRGYAAAVAATIADHGLDRAIFVGWSLGGHILLEAAPALPDASGFFLIATPPVGHPPALAEAFHPHPALPLLFQAQLAPQQLATLLGVIFGPDSTETAPLVADLRRADGRARLQLAATIAEGAYRDEIAVARSLNAPLALALGESDPLVSRRYLDSLALPNLWRGAVQVVPAAGHAPQWENTPAFDALLLAFIAGCATRQPATLAPTI